VINIFIGHDQRESIAFHVLEQSIIDKTSAPVAIIPLSNRMMRNFDGQRDGTNAFIYSRFLVPEMMDYQGWAIYLDSDMLLRDDLVKLWDLRDESKALMCVKHDYQTKHKRKLIGTPMEATNTDYPRKNWSSMMLWNCGHPMNKILSTDFVNESPGSMLHRFSWLTDDLVGEIPKEWNWLVGEYPLSAEAKLAHFTYGAPCFNHYRRCDYATEWHGTKEDVNHALDKSTLMGVA
jgi:hypothetical protein